LRIPAQAPVGNPFHPGIQFVKRNIGAEVNGFKLAVLVKLRHWRGGVELFIGGNSSIVSSCATGWSD
jgi:hypothetical protein